jgi:cytochrome c oxidase assembly protein subunit 15
MRAGVTEAGQPQTIDSMLGGVVARRRFRRMATSSAAFAFGLIVVGGIVRITGSGLGCGDDWPKCHGKWIPEFTLPTVIEYAHRLLAAGLSLLILAMLVYAVRHRAAAAFSGAGGLLRIAVVAAALLVIQVLLGAITVILELPASTTILHLATAMALLAALIVASIRAGGLGAASVLAADRPEQRVARKLRGAATAAAVLGFVVVVLGAMTANAGAPVTGAPSAAALACQGFPLCNGQLVPAGGSFVHIHWTHRILAFLFFFHVLAATLIAWRRNAPTAISTAATVSLVLAIAQLAVAALMVLFFLPREARALHLLLGTGVWAAVVVWVSLARRLPGRADQPSPNPTSRVA